MAPQKSKFAQWIFRMLPQKIFETTKILKHA